MPAAPWKLSDNVVIDVCLALSIVIASLNQVLNSIGSIVKYPIIAEGTAKAINGKVIDGADSCKCWAV